MEKQHIKRQKRETIYGIDFKMVSCDYTEFDLIELK